MDYSWQLVVTTPTGKGCVWPGSSLNVPPDMSNAVLTEQVFEAFLHQFPEYVPYRHKLTYRLATRPM